MDGCELQRREFLRCASTGVVATALAGGFASGAQAGDKAAKLRIDRSATPNVLLLITDQNSAGLTKRSGFPFDTMPGMDRLAAQGVDFERAYCTMPACVPSRTSMLTGRWPSAHRVRMNFQLDGAVCEKDLYQVAKEQGYRTGLVGKNHTYLKQGPTVDFLRDYTHEAGDRTNGSKPLIDKFEMWLQKLHFNVSTEPTPFALEAQLPYRIVTDAIEFVDKAGPSPFLLQVSMGEPHNPEQVPHPYWDMFPPAAIPDRGAADLGALKRLGYRAEWLHDLERYGHPPVDEQWRRYVSNYLGMLRMIDDQWKRLTDHLEAKGLMENTIIVRVADHGDYLMKYGLGRKGVGLPEVLTHIPMVWHGPGIKAEADTGKNCFVSMADLMPTICEVMKAPIPHGVQGRSLLPLLQGQDFPAVEFRSIYAEAGLGGLYYDRDDKISPDIAGVKDERFDELNMVTQSGNQKMVRMGKWKLVYDMMGYGQFYDLEKDPDELNNLFNRPEFAADQMALTNELLMWTIRNEDSLPTGRQFKKYQTKWPSQRSHNWYAPYRHGTPPAAFIP